MTPTRRDFLKSSATLAGSTLALDHLPLWAATPSKPADPGAEPIASAPSAATEEFTRGIGIYPGQPSEFHGPALVPVPNAYRNLALRRPAYHSSSYDYNLTAQLVTDGICATRMPSWVRISTNSQGELPRERREYPLDHAYLHRTELQGPDAALTIELGGDDLPLVSHLQISLLAPPAIALARLRFRVAVSDDGQEWTPAGQTIGAAPASLAGFPPDFCPAGRYIAPSIQLHAPQRRRFYRIQFDVPQARPAQAQAARWDVTQVAFFNGAQRLEIGGPYQFTSAWMSAGHAEEWVYVDLGASCTFDCIKLFWIARPVAGSVQVSDDAANWRDLASLAGRIGNNDDIALPSPAQGRYVRVLMTSPSNPIGYILSELEVYGRGGSIAQPSASTQPTHGNTLDLSTSGWWVERASEVQADGAGISTPGYTADTWLAATVPGTVLTSFLNAGAIPDPNFDQNQLYLSDSYFCADFWYRTEFTPAAVAPGTRVWLQLASVNWKADVFLNGHHLGRMEGGFIRGRFDVTQRLKPDQSNALAILVHKVHTPGSTKQKTLEHVGLNGGALGCDNPTYHASIGWDWIPTIRGRNTGILGPVTLETTGEATLENPYVWSKLPLPDISTADVHLEIDVVNHTPHRLSGILHAQFGDLHLERPIVLNGNTRATIPFTPASHPELKLQAPRLWWPAGYGDPHLYDVSFRLTVDSATLDAKTIHAGIRQMTFSEEGGALRLWINGRRFIARGGNWGFSESMLRYREREYDAAVRYHRAMNFTMIRNWVGQIGDDAFWEACDRHGIMVWQDFWLANPWDGPAPDNNVLFLANARDYLLRIRNHPCLALYCGRNEGFPPQALEQGLRATLRELHPDLHYIPSSADRVVSGHGPYRAMPRTFYFSATDAKLHSEIGAPAIPSLESVQAMMKPSSIWPQSLAWGLHDFCLDGAQGGASFREIVDTAFGGARSAEEWIRLAQFVNYDTYRAIFEAQSRHRMGVLLWMSHPCWPSFVWQTYDYYLEPTAAYFGCQKGSEPLHIQWNSLDETIEVVNYSAGKRSALVAEAEILALDSKQLAFRSAAVQSNEDTTTTCFRFNAPANLPAVHFIRLRLREHEQIVSTNFYWRASKGNDLHALRDLPKPVLQTSTTTALHDGTWQLTTELRNPGETPALMVRLMAVRAQSGDRILPALYEDNYFALMPGEARTVRTELRAADARGELPAIQVSA